MKDNNMPEKDLPSTFRDWAYLPPEIVQLISENVKSITDYVRFRAVCSPWCSASLPKPRHLPPQPPWLMLRYKPCPESTSPDEKDNGIRLLYDLWEGKMRRLHLPETIDMVCCASYHGWLLLASIKGRDVFLLNPLTRAQIHLPHITDSDGCRFDASFFVDSYMGYFSESKMTFSTDLADPNCLITVFLWRCRTICCRVGDPCWTIVTSRRDIPEDVAYYNGRFYLLYKGAMDITESNKPDVVSIVSIFEPKLQDLTMRLLEGKSGVHVVAFHPDQNVEVYQFQEQQLKLKVTDTSNTIVLSCSSIRPYLSVCSDNWDWFDGDSIYMEYNCLFRINEHSLTSHYSIFDADQDGNVMERIVRTPGTKRLFWSPDPAMWFQPSFS